MAEVLPPGDQSALIRIMRSTRQRPVHRVGRERHEHCPPANTRGARNQVSPTLPRALTSYIRRRRLTQINADRAFRREGWSSQEHPLNAQAAHEPPSKIQQLLHGLAEFGGFLKAGALAVLEMALGRWPKTGNVGRPELSMPDEQVRPPQQSARRKLGDWLRIVAASR